MQLQFSTQIPRMRQNAVRVQTKDKAGTKPVISYYVAEIQRLQSLDVFLAPSDSEPQHAKEQQVYLHQQLGRVVLFSVDVIPSVEVKMMMTSSIVVGALTHYIVEFNETASFRFRIFHWQLEAWLEGGVYEGLLFVVKIPVQKLYLTDIMLDDDNQFKLTAEFWEEFNGKKQKVSTVDDEDEEQSNA